MRIEEKSIDSALFLSAPGGWDNVVEAMKPGAHLLLFSDVKNHHVGAIAAEDNGLEIRDTVVWVFDSGKQIPEMLMVTVARKPLEGTVAANVLEHGTGALNVDGCRVSGAYETRDRDTSGGASMFGMGAGGGAFVPAEGRWPANLIHDNSPAVVSMFPNSKGASSQNNLSSVNIYQGQSLNESRTELNGFREWYNDDGSAARFFYSAPHLDDLLKYLLKLITPPGGTVLTNCDNILVQSAYPSVRYCGN